MDRDITNVQAHGLVKELPIVQCIQEKPSIFFSICCDSIIFDRTNYVKLGGTRRSGYGNCLQKTLNRHCHTLIVSKHGIFIYEDAFDKIKHDSSRTPRFHEALFYGGRVKEIIYRTKLNDIKRQYGLRMYVINNKKFGGNENCVVNNLNFIQLFISNLYQNFDNPLHSSDQFLEVSL
jgi:hypothetical protein